MSPLLPREDRRKRGKPFDFKFSSRVFAKYSSHVRLFIFTVALLLEYSYDWTTVSLPCMTRYQVATSTDRVDGKVSMKTRLMFPRPGTRCTIRFKLPLSAFEFGDPRNKDRAIAMDTRQID